MVGGERRVALVADGGRTTTMTSGEIAGVLREQIASARFALNDRLPPERQLAEQFGVARGTVREALRQLELLGMVCRRAGSGTYVTWRAPGSNGGVVEITRPLELVDARFAVEPHMCRLAIRHARDADLAALEGRLRVMESAEGDPERFAQEDEAFHLALASSTENPMILWMMETIHAVRTHVQWARMRTLTLKPAMIRTYNAQHRAIFDAICRREAEAAAQAMKTHLATARQSLVEATD